MTPHVSAADILCLECRAVPNIFRVRTCPWVSVLCECGCLHSAYQRLFTNEELLFVRHQMSATQQLPHFVLAVLREDARVHSVQNVDRDGSRQGRATARGERGPLCPQDDLSSRAGRFVGKRPTLANPVLAILICQFWPIHFWPSWFLPGQFWPIQFWPIQFWPIHGSVCVCHGGAKRWGPKVSLERGGPKGDDRRVGSKPRENLALNFGAPKGGPRRVRPEGQGPEGWGAQNFALFVSLWVFSGGILVVFEAPGDSNENTTKIQREDTQRETKRAKFWAVRRRGVRCRVGRVQTNNTQHNTTEHNRKQQHTTQHNNTQQHQPQHNTTKMDWPKLAGQMGWPKMDWPKLLAKGP